MGGPQGLYVVKKKKMGEVAGVGIKVGIPAFLYDLGQVSPYLRVSVSFFEQPQTCKDWRNLSKLPSGV
jgi:hypothetical protein